MNKPTVFFSHSSLDKEIAKFLKDKLIEYTGGTVQIFVSSDGESIPFGKIGCQLSSVVLKSLELCFCS